jgi:hypothetical protein
MKMRVRVRARLFARRPADLSVCVPLYPGTHRSSLAYVRVRVIENIYIAIYSQRACVRVREIRTAK